MCYDKNRVTIKFILLHLRFMHCLAPSSKNRRKVIHNGSPSGDFLTGTKCKGLQDVIRNIYILRDVAELISHIALVDGDVLIFEVRRIEGEVF